MATPGIVGKAHYLLAQEIRRTLAQYEDLKDIISMLGLEQLAPEDRNVVARARRLERFLTQPFFATEQFSGIKGKLVSLKDSLDGCERILRDEFKDYPESALYMIGAIDEAKEKFKPGKPAAKSDSGAKAGANVDAKPAVNSGPNAKLAAESKPHGKSDVKPTAVPKPNGKSDAKPVGGSNPDGAPDTQAAESKTDGKPAGDPKPDGKLDAKAAADSKPDAKPDVKPAAEPKPDAKADAEPGADPKPEPQAKPTSEPEVAHAAAGAHES